MAIGSSARLLVPALGIVLVGVAEVLIIGFIAWGCLRTAIRGQMTANP